MSHVHDGEQQQRRTFGSAPKFDPSFNWGHIGVIASVLLSAIFYYSKLSNEIDANTQFRNYYGPVINDMMALNKIEDERIANHGAILVDIRNDINNMKEQDRRDLDELRDNIQRLTLTLSRFRESSPIGGNRQ